MDTSVTYQHSTNIWREVSGGAIQLRTAINTATFLLNQTAARVWKEIDGIKTVDELIHSLAHTNGEAGLSVEQIEQTLHELQDRHLINEVKNIWE